MSETPPRSSIRSTTSRLPKSLRIPRRNITPSTASLSLFHAQANPTAPSTSSRPTLTSEEALSKQLDGDAGGRTMGLRSRRGSSATIRTTRTFSGVSEPSLPEEEREEPIAGPSNSSPALLQEVQEGDTGGVETGQGDMERRDGRGTLRLNPKASSSWLRWNSPAPTFPRSVSRDKGKGKENPSRDGVEVEREGEREVGLPRTDSPTSTDLPVVPQEATTAFYGAAPSSASDGTVKSNANTSAPEVHASDQAGAPARGRWWSRSGPTVKAKQDSTTVPILSEHSQPTGMEFDSPQSGRQVTIPEPNPGISSNTSTSGVISTDPSLESDGKGTASNDENVLREESPKPGVPEHGVQEEEKKQGSSGWRGYVWPTPKPQPSTIPGSEPSRAAQEATSDIVDDPPTAPVTKDTPAEESATDLPLSSQPPPPSANSGWGSYLYSFVATPATVDDASAKINTPTNLTEDQRPVPTTPPSLSVQAASPLPTETVPQTNLPSDSLSSTPTPAPSSATTRKGSTSSQSGWLNYLAFRASQKKITNTSTASIKSGKERKSLDAGEEVMDLSADPNFPTTQLDHAKPTTTSTEMTKEESLRERTKSREEPLSKKASQNLAVKSRRLSNASVQSSGTKSPLSSSPKMKSVSKMSNGSALPPPPAPAPVQPNFVVPSFDTTFNRPPRSLPPLKEATASASGLAWRAIGAVGSYVYSDDGKVAAGETRGLKEGRRVGAELPRRIGLAGEKEDDGWRNVKRVAVVGVHGWFPAKMLNSVIGEPTGTSVKFANMMGQAVKRFFSDKGIDDIRLTLMPLEGEGTIESRVDRLYKAYLSNPAWINDLRRADAVFFAAHSQGCIVTTHLISRMIAQGHIRTPLNADAVSRCEWAFGPIGVVPEINSRRRNQSPLAGAEGGHQKVAMLAMCGVHLGPLYSISTSSVIQPYLQWFENAAARELFEFQDSESGVSVAYQKALSMVLENEVKMVLLASYNDQVVPIYGASFSTATHPLLLRALFVDGPSYSASDFMTNLLAFAFMLRNAGIDDQRLVEHLSEATAGGLTGVGHSAPYEDAGCYDLTVRYLFLSGPARHPLPPLSIDPFSARDIKSDYELPWIMRALVDSPEVRDLFPEELKDLKEGIGAWRPITKALKEIKKRLEPMAGKQSRLRVGSSASLSEMGNSTNSKVGPTGKVRSRL